MDKHQGLREEPKNLAGGKAGRDVGPTAVVYNTFEISYVKIQKLVKHVLSAKLVKDSGKK